jgi:hypothetical protein
MTLSCRVAWHCSGTVVTCLLVLQALHVQHVCTSCRPMMVLMSGVLETCVCGLGTHRPSYIGRPARFFFMLEARGPQRATGDAVAVPEPSRQGGRIRSGRTRGTPEPSPTWRWGPELWYTWLRWSPPYQGSGI